MSKNEDYYVYLYSMFCIRTKKVLLHTVQNFGLFEKNSPMTQLTWVSKLTIQQLNVQIFFFRQVWAKNLISQTVQFQNVTKKDGAKFVPFFLEIWNNFLLTAASEREVSQALSKKKSYSGLILRAYSYGLYQESCSFKHPGLNSPQKFLLNNLVYLKF